MTELPRFEAPRIVSGTYAGQTLDEAFDLAFRQLADAVDTYVNDELVPRLMTKRYLSYKDLSVRWAIPVETLRKWRSAGYRGFEHLGVQMGKHVRFDEAEVAAWEETLRASA